MTFQGASGVNPDPGNRPGGWLDGWSPGPSKHNSRIPEPDSRCPENETGSLEIEKSLHRYMIHWKRDYR